MPLPSTSTNSTTKTNILEKYNPQFEYAGALMSLLLSLQYLNLWLNAKPIDAEKILNFSGLILIEFIMIHSGVFMASVSKWISLLIFVPFYGLFVYKLYPEYGTEFLMYTYFAVILNRMRFAFFNVNPKLKKEQAMFSALSLIIYLLPLAAVLMLQDKIPYFKLTPEFLNQINFDNKDVDDDIFREKPNLAIGLGFIYFLMLSLFQFFRQWKKRKEFILTPDV